MLVIAIASSDEISSIKKKTVITQQEVYSGALFIRGTLHGKEILMVKTGIGAKKAAAAARQIINNCLPACVLAVGAAGARLPGPAVRVSARAGGGVPGRSRSCPPRA